MSGDNAFAEILHGEHADDLAVCVAHQQVADVSGEHLTDREERVRGVREAGGRDVLCPH